MPELRQAAFLFVAACALAGDQTAFQNTPREAGRLKSPSAKVQARVAALLPRVQAWYEHTEACLHPQGRPLSVRELAMAKILGIENPDLIRVVVLERFPLPSDPELLREALRLGFDNGNVVGRTNGNVILLKPESARDETVLAHELVHVGQIRRMGVKGFLRQYLLELESVGYRRAPLELEAWSKQDLPKSQLGPG